MILLAKKYWLIFICFFMVLIFQASHKNINVNVFRICRITCRVTCASFLDKNFGDKKLRNWDKSFRIKNYNKMISYVKTTKKHEWATWVTFSITFQPMTGWRVTTSALRLYSPVELSASLILAHSFYVPKPYQLWAWI